MRLRNTKIILGCVFAVVIIMMAGCGKGKTSDNVLKTMAEKMKEVNSISGNMVLEIRTALESEVVSFNMNMVYDVIAEDNDSFMTGNISTEINSEKEDVPSWSHEGYETFYHVKEDDEYVLYGGEAGQMETWWKLVVDEQGFISIPAMIDVENWDKEAAFSEKTTKINKRRCFLLSGEISGEKCIEIMGGIFAMYDMMGILSLSDKTVQENVKVPFELEIYEDTNLPARLSFDIEEFLSGIMAEGTSEEGEKRMKMMVTITQYDKAEAITVPELIRERASFLRFAPIEEE